MKTISISKILLIQTIAAVFIAVAAVTFFSLSEYRKGIINMSADAKLSGDIYSFQAYSREHFGDLSLNGTVIVDSKGSAIDGKFEAVDEVAKDLGIAATIFAADGDDFRRVITNIKKADGSRAVGTKLGKDSAAYIPVTKGELFKGEALILGIPYYTAYQPMKDINGKIIGIYFVGIPKAFLNSREGAFFGDFIIKAVSATIAVIAVFCVFIWLFTKRLLARRLDRLQDSLAAISHGNLAVNIDTERMDEIGMLTQSVNNTVSSFRTVVSSIQDNARVLSSAIEDIASVNTEISEGSTKQSGSVQNIAAAVQESATSIKQSAEAAIGSSEYKQNISGLVAEGTENAHGSIQAMSEIGESSKHIADILTLINEISFQTNLLALNAAVEAARAGEHGRGFAVVAGEVRNLATRSGTAAKEIEGLIREMLGKIRTGTDFVNRNGEMLERISGMMNEMAKSITEIASATSEQERGISQIRDSTENLDVLSQSNAAMTEQASASIESIVKLSRDMIETVKTFKL